jgi:magnesium chelatase family protein
MSNQDIAAHCSLSDSSQMLLQQATGSLNLSPRSYMRLLKVARTIADMSGSKMIAEEHIAEALQYRHITSRPAVAV